jgi:hypothetical protein
MTYPVSLNLPTVRVIMLLYILLTWEDFCEFMVWLVDVQNGCYGLVTWCAEWLLRFGYLMCRMFVTVWLLDVQSGYGLVTWCAECLFRFGYLMCRVVVTVWLLNVQSGYALVTWCAECLLRFGYLMCRVVVVVWLLDVQSGYGLVTWCAEWLYLCKHGI